MAASLRRRALVSCLAIAGLLGQACDAPRIVTPSMSPSFAKSGGGPSVNAASPASGHQGDVTLDVAIAGSGFDNGSLASWQINGAAYPKIRVNNTRFNSTTSLTANITIAADAAVATYDIAVVTSTGKKGIGAELFTVTYAIALGGLSEGRAISENGLVAGANGTTALAWKPGVGAVIVAPNSMVWDVDRNGHTIGGKDAAGKPVLWTSSTGLAGSWVAANTSDLGNGGAVRGIASDANGDAILLTGNVFALDNSKHAVVWTRAAGAWQQRVFPVPVGLVGAFGQAINARGQVVGMDGTGCCTAVYWDSLGAPTTLARLPGVRNAAAYSINGDGTIIVGNSGVSAVLWRRTLTNGVYGSWSGAIALENTAALCGKSGSSIAYDLNSAGTVVVGSSCDVAVSWKLAGGGVTSRVVMQGLGPPNQSAAYGVNDAGAPLASGTAKNGTGVYWWGF